MQFAEALANPAFALPATQGTLAGVTAGLSTKVKTALVLFPALAALFLVNAAINIWLAPRVGRIIARFGERNALVFEYIGLIIVFAAYAFVDDARVAAGLYLIDHLFYALAIAKKEDYERVGIPMLPVTHGNKFTRQFILLYTILLVLITILPYLSGMSGLIYLVAALALGGTFLYYAVRLKGDDGVELPMRVFRYSINYLMYLFAALLIDHYFIIRLGL